MFAADVAVFPFQPILLFFHIQCYFLIDSLCDQSREYPLPPMLAVIAVRFESYTLLMYFRYFPIALLCDLFCGLRYVTVTASTKVSFTFVSWCPSTTLSPLRMHLSAYTHGFRLWSR
uniref:Secreted protein n=1 Tax=Panagrellus redivivus TaxID=6233 RepID=A0A7E4ZW50_PANRE